MTGNTWLLEQVYQDKNAETGLAQQVARTWQPEQEEQAEQDR